MELGETISEPERFYDSHIGNTEKQGEMEDFIMNTSMYSIQNYNEYFA